MTDLGYKDAIRAAPRVGFTRRRVAILLVLQVGAVAFEGLGISMLLPVFQFMQAGEAIGPLADSTFWRWIISAHEALGLGVSLVTLLAASFAGILFRQAFVYARMIYEARVNESSIQSLRNLGFRRYLTARVTAQEDVRLGAVVNDLVVEAPRAVAAVMCVVRVAGGTILMAFYAGLLTLLSPWMTLASSIVFGAAIGMLRRLLGQSREASQRISESSRTVATFLAERLKAVRLIRLSGTQAGEIARMEMLTLRQAKRAVHFQSLGASINTLMEPVVVAFSFVMLYVATTVAAMPLESIGLFLLILLRLLPAVTEMVKMHHVVLGFSASLRAVEQRLAALESAREDKGGELSFSGLRRAIRFNGVTFDYGLGTEVPALHDISLDIPAGQMTALVGPSGSGKSTLIDLLPRLRDPTGGAISIDGAVLTEFALDSLRAGIAYVSQSPQIFDVLVAEHIRYGNPKATDDEVRAAAQLAGAAEFIEKVPKGYDTALGEDGHRLSGGQRQRLDLARALARRSPVLILDEPTSQLDADAEVKFREALRRIRRETSTTIVVIAHRLSTVADADQIIVLDGGRLIAIGTHEALLRRGGWYAEAFAKQTAGAAPLNATGT